MPARLIALADPDALGFPWSRRTTDRLRKTDPAFPRTIEMSGRLFVDAGELAEYHVVLRERGVGKTCRRPGVPAEAAK